MRALRKFIDAQLRMSNVQVSVKLLCGSDLFRGVISDGMTLEDGREVFALWDSDEPQAWVFIEDDRGIWRQVGTAWKEVVLIGRVN